jgi:hypothetical protein
MTRAPSSAESNRSTPAEKAMKQTSKTDAESGDGGASDGSGAEPAGPADRAVRPGDAGVGQSPNQGSSPYQDRVRAEEADRSTR